MAHRFVVVLLALCVVGSARAAEVIVNEYNAVEDKQILQNGTGDAYLGSNVSFCDEDDDGEIEVDPRKACVDDTDCNGTHEPRCLSGRLQNGGDWFELVVIQDHLDMRDWDIGVTQGGLSFPCVTNGVSCFILVLTDDLIWSDLRSGTIITVAEDIPNNVGDYQPETGDWWINVRAADGAAGTYISNTDFPTSNDKSQITVRDQNNIVIFGPAGEGVNPLSGVGNTEVFKLEADPSASIIPGSPGNPNYWNDGSSSTFGQPNLWSGGVSQQDFSALRSVVPYSPLTSIIINEVNTHTDPDRDWIELYNTTGSTVDVSGWFLSDNTDDLMKYVFPTTTEIPAGGYLVIDEDELVVFRLNGESGDEVYLSKGNGSVMTGERTWIQFGPIENAVSWGRFPNRTGPLYRMTTQTEGAGNSAPIISDVVINEIMYNPECVELSPPCPPTGCCDGSGSISHDEKEYIELYNASGSSVDLWRDFLAPAGIFGWRITDGIDFEFAEHTTLGPGEFLLVVRFDPVSEPTKLADFRTFYGVPTTQIVGPYGPGALNPGGLNDFNDQLDLRRPDIPHFDDEICNCWVAPMVVWDGVHYWDFGEWPVGADGMGFSLERRDALAVSQPPWNWAASTTINGTPGAVNSVPEPALVLQLVSGGLALAFLYRRRAADMSRRDRAGSSGRRDLGAFVEEPISLGDAASPSCNR
jgi:hypothetical protein